MELSPTVLALVALALAGWTLLASWMMISSGNKSQKAEASRKAARRMARMLDEAPAIPLLVRADGRIEGSERLADWLGFESLPYYLSELCADNIAKSEGSEENGDKADPKRKAGLTAAQVEELAERVRQTQKTAQPFQLAFTLPGANRSLAFKGVLADPQFSPGGAALVWVFDFSESQYELLSLREDAQKAKSDFNALIGLIEAAPIPMWYRGPEGALRLVNKAYVDAVGAMDSSQVVADGIELIEPVDGLSAAQVASQVFAQNLAAERIVSATIGGQRRSLRVSDMPLGGDGVAGYAIDIEEMEELAREYRAFKGAQRSILDQLSIGVGQFDGSRELIFANQPFRRIFKLHSGAVAQRLEFSRFLSGARDDGRTPEVRDFRAWREEITAWFSSGNVQEERWPLLDGTHIRIIGQPMPDGGLVIIAEDQTEQLALSATRDTLLRTRTATFDSLFEALAVFAPDGRLHIWNRSFASTWGVEPELLDNHPSATKLLEAIAPNLARPLNSRSIGEVIRAATLDRENRAGRISMADGRTLEFAGVPLPDGNGLLTTLDVTANEQAEAALRERNLALEAADEVKTRFLSNMSYELRTPLTSIGGFAELLQAGVAGPLNAQAGEYLQAILDSVARLTDQVENILDLSQSEAGLMPLHLSEIAVVPFLTEIVRSRSDLVNKQQIKLDMRVGGGCGNINVDARQMGRAIGHLLDNAIEATPKGGKVLVNVTDRGGKSRIVISNSGKGMSRAEIDWAMGTAGNSQGESETRMGLGIPLARQLIEAHGGSLKLAAEAGSGTTMTIMIG